MIVAGEASSFTSPLNPNSPETLCDADHVVFGCDKVNNVFAETGYWTILVECLRCMPDICRDGCCSDSATGYRRCCHWPFRSLRLTLADTEAVNLNVIGAKIGVIVFKAASDVFQPGK